MLSQIPSYFGNQKYVLILFYSFFNIDVTEVSIIFTDDWIDDQIIQVCPLNLINCLCSECQQF